MESTKVCFKCYTEKPASQFYKHPKMPDGRLNKCKECTKKDVRDNYEKNIENPEYLEKERLRGRVKYDKYKYVNKTQHTENRDTAAQLRRRGYDLTGFEIHHWNYNKDKSIFILNPRAHKLIHKYLLFDKVSNMFLFNGELLDTVEKSLEFIINVFEKHEKNYEVKFIDFSIEN